MHGEAHGDAIKQFNLNPGNVVKRISDCRDLSASHIANDSIDATVTSPPYRIEVLYEAHPRIRTVKSRVIGVPVLFRGVEGCFSDGTDARTRRVP